MTQIKVIIYGVAIAVIVIGSGYILNVWHYKPMAELSKKISAQHDELVETRADMAAKDADAFEDKFKTVFDIEKEKNETTTIDAHNGNYSIEL